MLLIFNEQGMLYPDEFEMGENVLKKHVENMSKPTNY
jgi:hypothetical protein